MHTELVPQTREIAEAFVEEIAVSGGTVPDVYDDGRHMFLRGILPPSDEVRPGDRFKHGVALQCCGPDVLVHPYLYRIVCRNGAIAARAAEGSRVERRDSSGCPGAAEQVLLELRAAVHACTDEGILAGACESMRSMTQLRADHVINLLPGLLRLPRPQAQHYVELILSQYREDGDRSAYGVMNAITAVARDARDPDARWRLEEAGGAMVRLVRVPERRHAAGALLPV
jgi:hypothetical protein